MSASSVPGIHFTPAGLVLPAETDVLDGVISDINAAFGGGLNPGLETPQGQIASSLAAVIADKNAEFAYLANQVDPQYADGRFQDAIARIYLLARKPATATVVAATLTGVSGAVIPAGTLAQDTSGNVYSCLGDVTIGLAGTAAAQFENIVTGPIPCAAGTLTQVYQAVIGWDAITNDAPGTLGSEVESRADFEYRRINSVAFSARGTVQAIYANVFNISGVLDVYVTENYLSTSATVGATSYSLAPHSVYVAVVGGSDADVAKAIWAKKDVGCDYNGNTTVSVADDSGYNYPYPTYAVSFERPAALPVLFDIEIVNDPSLPSDIVTLIKNAVVARFNGTDGTTRERIGATILASRYYGAVVSAASNVSLISILIGTSAPTLTQVQVGIDQRPSLDVSDITVTLV